MSLADRHLVPGSLRGPDPRVLIDDVEDAIVVVGADLTLTYLNRAARFVLGIEEEFTAALPSLTTPPPEPPPVANGLEVVHPDDRDAVIAALGAVFAEPGSRVQIEFRVLHPDGEKPVAAIATNRLDLPGIEGIVVCFRDLSLLKTQERRMQQLASTLESTTDVVVQHDRDGAIVHANGAARVLLGFDLLASSWRYPPELRTVVKAEILPALAESASWEGEIVVRDGDGVERALSVVASAVLDRVGAIEHFTLSGRDITESKRVEGMLRYRAHHDSLTGLFNRVALLDYLHEVVSERPPLGSVAVVFVDLDRFKQVNDSLGHDFGDDLLVIVAERLRSIVREEDFLARLGGDEFVLVMRSPSRAATSRGSTGSGRATGPGGTVGPGGSAIERAATALAQRIIDAVRAPVEIVGTRVHVSASIGIAINDEEVPASMLLRNADLAMFRSKQRGRGRFQRFEPALAEEAERVLRVESELHDAVERNAMFVMYQPIVAAGDGSLLGFEALARWRHPAGVRAPDAFLEIAERSELICRIDGLVMEHACRQLHDWDLSAGASQLSMAVNMSARQLGRPDLSDLVVEVLERQRISPERLVIEITESNLIEDVSATMATIGRLRTLGVQLAIDDFGVGYSSLSYLRAFGADVVKIDRSFVEHLGRSTADQSIVAAITQIAGTFGMRTIAEGVENDEQLAVVRRLGCDAVQGFGIASPMEGAEATAYLRARA